MTATEQLLTEIRDEIRAMRQEQNAMGRDAPIVNRLTRIIEELELIRDAKDQLDAEKGPRMFPGWRAGDE